MSKNQYFHPGELRMQQISGVNELVAQLAPRLMQTSLNQQQRDFYPLLNTLFVASVDDQARSWASILCAQPGFIRVLDQKHLTIKVNPILTDPLWRNLKSNQHLGLLGLQFHTRRRNRISAKLINVDNGQIDLEVIQALGNCPKYIQTRKLNLFDSVNNIAQTQRVQRIDYFDHNTKKLISTADTFFIASYYPQTKYRGADISHRGGKVGFVSIENDRTLCFDDFSGNNLYMTLGNLIHNPLAGLLFIDFKTGDTLQLSCRCEIIETPNAKYARQIRLKLEYGWYHEAAMPLRWEFLEYSPFLD